MCHENNLWKLLWGLFLTRSDAYLTLLSFFRFLLQRTVFPKDYHVVHHYRKSMFCDDDPVSCCPWPELLLRFATVLLVNAELGKRFAAPWIIELACDGATAVVLVLIAPVCLTLTLGPLSPPTLPVLRVPSCSSPPGFLGSSSQKPLGWAPEPFLNPRHKADTG